MGNYRNKYHNVTLELGSSPPLAARASVGPVVWTGICIGCRSRTVQGRNFFRASLSSISRQVKKRNGPSCQTALSTLTRSPGQSLFITGAIICLLTSCSFFLPSRYAPLPPSVPFLLAMMSLLVAPVLGLAEDNIDIYLTTNSDACKQLLMHAFH